MKGFNSPLDERKFIKLVKSLGYDVKPITKHFEITDTNGDRIYNYPVRHKKGGKREVIPVYINRFLKIIGELDHE